MNNVINNAVNNVHKVRKWFPEKIEMYAYFEKPCKKLKYQNNNWKI